MYDDRCLNALLTVGNLPLHNRIWCAYDSMAILISSRTCTMPWDDASYSRGHPSTRVVPPGEMSTSLEYFRLRIGRAEFLGEVRLKMHSQHRRRRIPDK